MVPQLVAQRKETTMNPTTTDGGFVDSLASKYNLYPFWPAQMGDSEKHERMNSFYATIFFRWFNVVQNTTRARLEYDALIERTGEPYDPVKNPYKELTILHECDRAIFESGSRPDRTSAATKSAEYKRSEIAGQYKQAVGE